MNTSPRYDKPRPALFVSGRAVTVRPAEADDLGLLTTLVARLSARTCHQRYLVARSFTFASARAEAERIVAAHNPRHLALVAVAPFFGAEDLLGVAELVPRDEEEGLGELGIVVRDDMQGYGVGSLLMQAITAAAPQLGVHALHMDLLADNSAMRRLAARIGPPIVTLARDGVMQLRVNLDGRGGAHEQQVATAGRLGDHSPRRAA